MKVIVALVSGVLLSSAAIAQHEHGASTGGGNETATEARESSSGHANTQAQDENGEGANRRICRRIERTSSRVGRDRVCMTAAQWREHDRND